ncbi:metallo-beta-lactamase superfamily [Trichoderma arundinaceum]|uniref:Metallo-beta-lactamase superfamily n=1 Tax=Trichoderma arundinaceum TaxID=490622 RepID=A0A395NAD6_TRIAR|nr:metallo-beta-lactamase superfamily [Trichoderma arundinaceum]
MGLPFDLPSGNVSVKVAFICNALLTGIPMSRFVSPNIRGLEFLDQTPTFSFFIQHPSGKRLLFDLGVRKDWHNLSPTTAQRLAEAGWKAEVSQDVPEILQENGISLESIETVIWSHWHWDHVGDISKLPSSVSVLVGPGFSSAMTPGYPENQKSPILESDYSGRFMTEIKEFDLSVGGLPAHDYFGDGSLFILSTPGHAVGHLSALARTTSHDSEAGDTYILMGGDCCHHMSQLRPSNQCPLPRSVWMNTNWDVAPRSQNDMAWRSIHHSKGSSTPFTNVSDHPNGASAASSPADAMVSLRKLRDFDAQNGSIFFAAAHDKSLLSAIELFPSFANDWKRKGWAEQARWSFLEELAQKNPALENIGYNGSDLCFEEVEVSSS